MKNFFTKFKYTIIGILLAIGTTVSAANITVPSAPGAGYDLTSTSTGAYVSTTTNPRYLGSVYASTTNPNYFFGPLLLPNLTQGYSFIGSGGRIGTISTSTLASNLTALCSTITGGSGLCDGVDDTSSGGNSLASSTPWTFGNLVTALTNGTVTTISTSTLVNNIFPFTAWGGFSTTSVPLFSNGLLSLSSTTINGAKFSDLSQGFAYIGSSGKLNTMSSSTPNLSWFTNDLANLTAGNSSLTFSGNYNGSAARNIVLNVANTNTWSVLQNFNYSSSTAYASFVLSSTTDAYFGTGQGIAYVGSNGRLRTTATSTFALSGFTNDLANLSATDSTLTFSGNYNGAAARTVGLNLGNANTWTVNQTFNYSSSTAYSSFVRASTTALHVGSGQGYGFIGSNGLFGVISTSTLAGNLTALCSTITGSSALCDGDDATGGAGSVSTSTVDYIIYKKGTNTVVYDTITNTDVLTTTSFGAACNYIINNATSTFPARSKIAVRAGYYNAVADCIIDGNSNQYGPTFDFQFQASSTEIYVGSGINAFRFQNQASANITNLTCGVAGTGTCLFATTTSGTQSSLRESYFKGLNVHATTTHTGWAVDLINPFRNHFESVDLKFVANGVRERCNTSGFNCGDTTYERGFTEILNSSIGYMVKMEGNAGTHNQNTFIDWNGISNDTDDVMWYFKKSNWNRVLSSNAEEFATTTEYYNSNSNVFISNKYMNLGNSGGTVFFNDANSYNNTFECKYVELTGATVLMRDQNTVATTRPNAFGNFSGGTCTIGDDGGSASFATTTSSVVANIHDNLTGALSYLNSTKLTGNRLHFNWNSVFTTFLEYVGSALRFVVGGNEILNMTSTGAVGSLVWDFGGASSLEIPNGTSNTSNAVGQIYLDTTDNQLVVATSTVATNVAIPLKMKLWSGTIASTSVDFVSGGRIPLNSWSDGVIITEIRCQSDAGTSKVINLDTLAGGSNTDSVTCATTETSDTAMSANYNVAAGTSMAVELGATTGSVDYVTFSVWGYTLRE